MINVQEITRQLAGNAEAIRALAETCSDEQAQWQPRPEAWSMHKVVEHLYNEERIDFRRHLKEMYGEGPQPSERLSVEDSRQALAGFLAERKASIAWLLALASPDWGLTKTMRFGPSDTITLSAGDILLSWVEHDVLHLRQIVELLHGWNEHQAAPYSLQYAGGW